MALVYTVIGVWGVLARRGLRARSPKVDIHSQTRVGTASEDHRAYCDRCAYRRRVRVAPPSLPVLLEVYTPCTDVTGGLRTPPAGSRRLPSASRPRGGIYTAIPTGSRREPSPCHWAGGAPTVVTHPCRPRSWAAQASARSASANRSRPMSIPAPLSAPSPGESSPFPVLGASGPLAAPGTCTPVALAVDRHSLTTGAGVLAATARIFSSSSW